MSVKICRFYDKLSAKITFFGIGTQIEYSSSVKQKTKTINKEKNKKMNNINFLNKEAIMLQRFFNNDDIDWFGNNLFQIDNNKMNGVPPVNIS